MGGISPALCGNCSVNLSEINTDIQRHERKLEKLQEEIEELKAHYNDSLSALNEKVTEVRIGVGKIESEVTHIKELINQYTSVATQSFADLRRVYRIND